MRLSITTVEAYRLWRDTGDWMAIEDLEATIRKDAPENYKMVRGRAFHAVIEHPDETMIGDCYQAEGIGFAKVGIERVLQLLPPNRVCEAKATMDIDGITLVGKADALHGLDVYEAKCSEKIDVERYVDAFQWRAYLVLFNAWRVTYLLAQAVDGPYIEIRDVLPVPLYRYPNVREDVRRLANECADFIVQRNLESYVQDLEAA